MRLLITAGPTRERLDAVRFLSNRSSGAMGVALANAASAAGHGVTLLLGPVDSSVAGSVDGRVSTWRFESAADLELLLAERFGVCEVLVMAAAVSDYRVSAGGEVAGKMERGAGLRLDLESTPDLVAGCAARKSGGQRVVAFALEAADVLEARALAKLRRKGVDAIVANPLATMESGEVSGVLLWADGRREEPGGDGGVEGSGGAMGKSAFAAWLVGRVAG